jgi:hypothetical protein
MKKQLLMIAAVCCAAAVQAANVFLDISSSFNYDAFATDAEMGANGILAIDLGDHNLDYGQLGFAHCADSSKGVGSDGLVDQNNFEVAKGLARKFDSEDGKTKVNNSVSFIEQDDVTKKVSSITLLPAEQQNYATLNLLVNGNRYTKRPGIAMSAMIEVKYVGDDVWYTLWSEKVAIDNGEKGGCFGGALIQDAYSMQSDAWTALQTGSHVTKKSEGKTVASSGAKSYMYKLAKPLELDSTKKLEAFRMTATTPEKHRVNEYILYAVTATTP